MRHLAIIIIKDKDEEKLLQLYKNKPIITNCVEETIKTDFFDEIMVFTKNKKIIELAQQHNLTTPFNIKEEYTYDSVSMSQVLIKILDNYRSRGVLFKYACSIHPYATTLNIECIKKAYKKMKTDKLDSVIPLHAFDRPIQKAYKLNKEKVEMLLPRYEEASKQELETCYYDSEQFYWFDTQKLKQNERLVSKNTGAIILTKEESQKNENLKSIPHQLIYTLNENEYTFSR